MLHVLLIMLGGAVGALLRYGLSKLVQPEDVDFPFGTLTVNVVGCLAMGFVAALVAGPEREAYRMVVLVGLLGAFTTFSTYGIEALTLLENGKFARLLGYVAASNVAGIGGVWVGSKLAAMVFGSPEAV